MRRRSLVPTRRGFVHGSAALRGRCGRTTRVYWAYGIATVDLGNRGREGGFVVVVPSMAVYLASRGGGHQCAGCRAERPLVLGARREGGGVVWGRHVGTRGGVETGVVGGVFRGGFAELACWVLRGWRLLHSLVG